MAPERMAEENTTNTNAWLFKADLMVDTQLDLVTGSAFKKDEEGASSQLMDAAIEGKYSGRLGKYTMQQIAGMEIATSEKVNMFAISLGSVTSHKGFRKPMVVPIAFEV